MLPDRPAPAFVVDTCTIVNFAASDRLDLLERVLDGRGSWTQSTADEVHRAADHWPILWTVPTAGWLGSPIEPGRDRDLRGVLALQRQLGGTRREPRKHLAEAEALHVLLHYPEFDRAVLLTDDRPAADVATKRGITVWKSADVLSAAHRAGHIGCPAAFGVLLDMQQAGRGVHVPTDHSVVCP